MPLCWEEHYAREEALAEGYCNSIRAKFGLDNYTGDEDCESESCREHCKFMEGKE